MLALPEGEKPRSVHWRVVVIVPLIAAVPIRALQRPLHVRSRQDCVTASLVDSYLDTSSIGLFLVPVEEPLPLQYKNSVKMRTIGFVELASLRVNGIGPIGASIGHADRL